MCVREVDVTMMISTAAAEEEGIQWVARVRVRVRAVIAIAIAVTPTEPESSHNIAVDVTHCRGWCRPLSPSLSQQKGGHFVHARVRQSVHYNSSFGVSSRTQRIQHGLAEI